MIGGAEAAGVFIVGLLAATVRTATPLIFAGIGELFAERAGVMNLGIEGIMLMGAISGFVGAEVTGNAWLGIGLGMLVGIVLGLVMSFVTITLNTDQVISGLALTLLGSGLSFYIFRAIYGFTGLTPPHVPLLSLIEIPLLGQIPALGEIFFQQNLATYISWIVVVLSAVILFRTPLGLRITAVGENPKSAFTLGVSVTRIRYLSVIIGGMMAGVAGALLPLTFVGTFSPYMTAGRGFIAIAVVIFGNWTPYRMVGGAVIFGIVDSFQLRIQAVLGYKVIPYQFLLMTPYIMTVLVLLVISKSAKSPSALGKTFKET